jgi:hypothetical protein
VLRLSERLLGSVHNQRSRFAEEALRRDGQMGQRYRKDRRVGKAQDFFDFFLIISQQAEIILPINKEIRRMPMPFIF